VHFGVILPNHGKGSNPDRIAGWTERNNPSGLNL